MHGRGTACGGAGKGGSGGGTSAWHLPCLPWAQKYQLLPSHRACPADLEGPEPQGGQLGQMHPRRWVKEEVCGGHHLPWDPRAQTPLSFSSSVQTTLLILSFTPSSSPSTSPSASLPGQPRGLQPAGPASLTLGPSVPGVPGRPRGPWRPWAPGEPRSPGKPRSPCGRDTKEQLGKRDGVEVQGEAGKWGADGKPRTQGNCTAGGIGRAVQGEGRPRDTGGNGHQDTHSGAHEARSASFTGNTLENKKHV